MSPPSRAGPHTQTTNHKPPGYPASTSSHGCQPVQSRGGGGGGSQKRSRCEPSPTICQKLGGGKGSGGWWEGLRATHYCRRHTPGGGGGGLPAVGQTLFLVFHIIRILHQIFSILTTNTWGQTKIFAGQCS